MKRPVIVQVVQELCPPGGIQVMVLELERWLAPEFDVHVVSLEGTVERLRQTWSRAIPLGDRLHALDKPNRRDGKTVLRLTSLLRRLRPIAVHTHHIGPLLYGGLAARLAGVRRLVHTEHDAWHLAAPHHRMLQRAALAAFRPRLVADAGLVAEALIQAIPSSRPQIILNGIDTTRFSPGDRSAARRKLGLPESGPLVGTAGRLEPIKGHGLVIDAVAKLPPPVGLAIAGDGSCRPELDERVVASRLADRVHFLGHVDDMEDFYRSIDVFCLASQAEGLPLALLEAQACGVPAVGTDVGAVREVLAPGASFAVEPGDIEGLTEGLRQLLERPSPVHPRPFVTERHHARRMADDYRTIFIA